MDRPSPSPRSSDRPQIVVAVHPELLADPADRERVAALLRDRAADGTGVTTVPADAEPDAATPSAEPFDVVAARLAFASGADRLEVWVDTPGFFSADPAAIPTARLLRRLSYAEAQEIATAGGGPLHPHAIRAAREAGIPIHLCAPRDPHAAGTVVGPDTTDGSAILKAIAWRDGVVVVSMETLGMWGEVGFLAQAFGIFAEAGISVDLVTTSETNVTVTLDAVGGALDPPTLERAIARLSEFCGVEVVRPCTAVTLVGRRIRGLLHRLTPTLEAFEEHRLHLVSHAAGDINFTVVVDEEEGARLVRQLHRSLVAEPGSPDVFGPSWQELVHGEAPLSTDAWWQHAREPLLEQFAGIEAGYVYHLDTVRERARRLLDLAPVSRVLYAVKANPHPAILRALHDEGVGFECVSRREVETVLDVVRGLSPPSLLFTPNFAPRDEYAFALERGVQVTLDALHPLVHWPELFEGREIFVRLDPGAGGGHHEKVHTAGPRSKFGLPPSELDELDRQLRAVGATVTGLHVHAGSGIPGPEHWAQTGRFLLELAAARFPRARVVDLGGGLPIPHRPGEAPLDLEALAAGLVALRETRPDLELWLEPGRFLVGEAGILLARVTQTKEKGPLRYVGVATGMNSLIRPTLYGAYHDIVNLTRLDEPRTERVQIVGPICETGDRLGMDRLLPPTREGDLLLVATCGAYGRVMASSYNLREPAEEFVV